MQTFKSWRSLLEGKLSMAQIKPGATATPMWKGRSAKNYGIAGEPVYEGKIKVLGLGMVPYGKDANKSHILGKDYKDVQNKFKDIWSSDDIKYGNFWNAQDKMKNFFQTIAFEDKKIKEGYVSWIWQVIDGPNKGTIHYCFINSDDKWEISYLNKSAEFELVT